MMTITASNFWCEWHKIAVQRTIDSKTDKESLKHDWLQYSKICFKHFVILWQQMATHSKWTISHSFLLSNECGFMVINVPYQHVEAETKFLNFVEDIIGGKPLSEPMMISFTDAYMRHTVSMG